MTPDEREHMHILCERIAKEQDHERFVKLVQELNDLLEHKEQRMENSSKNAWASASVPAAQCCQNQNLVKRAKPLDSLYPLASEANIKSPNFPVRLCEIDKIGI